MILPTSQAYVDTSSTLQPFRARCRVVPLGIVPEDFETPDAAKVQSTRERYGGRFVLFSGRHRYYKGLEHLVQAAADIQAPVVIAGDGPERARLMAMAKEGGGKIQFPGALSDADLVNHLHACDVFAFPSTHRSEAFGISILEAQACGKPVVATRLGTGVELANLDGVTGINVPVADAAALADAINTLLNDGALRERLGRQARDRVKRDFNAAAIARREYSLYEEALG